MPLERGAQIVVTSWACALVGVAASLAWVTLTTRRMPDHVVPLRWNLLQDVGAWYLLVLVATLALAMWGFRAAFANGWIGYLALFLVAMCASEFARWRHNRRVKRRGSALAPVRDAPLD
jgi:hypothetical protein